MSRKIHNGNTCDANAESISPLGSYSNNVGECLSRGNNLYVLMTGCSVKTVSGPDPGVSSVIGDPHFTTHDGLECSKSVCTKKTFPWHNQKIWFVFYSVF